MNADHISLLKMRIPEIGGLQFGAILVNYPPLIEVGASEMLSHPFKKFDIYVSTYF